jgi:hypothetical protein
MDTGLTFLSFCGSQEAGKMQNGHRALRLWVLDFRAHSMLKAAFVHAFVDYHIDASGTSIISSSIDVRSFKEMSGKLSPMLRGLRRDENSPDDIY